MSGKNQLFKSAKLSSSGGIFAGAGFEKSARFGKNARFWPEPESGTALAMTHHL